MALQISDFTVAAAKGDDRIIEVKDQEQLKSSGFFGRTFRSAGKDVETNQTTMKAFVASVHMEKGDLLANVAKVRLTELMDGGKPLDGRMIKTVMQELESLQHETKTVNEQFFQRFLYDQGPNGLRGLVAAHLPPGTQLGPNDLEPIARQVQLRMQACTQRNETMTLATARDAIFPFRENLASLTPEALTRLNAFVDNHAQYGLTRPQAETMRTLMLSNGIHSQVMIDKTMEFFATFKELLPKLEACKDGPELMAVLEPLNKKFQTLFPKDQPLDGPTAHDHALPAAFEGVLRLSGYTPEKTMTLLTSVLLGKPGTEVCCSCSTVLDRHNSPAHYVMLMPLVGMRRMIEDAVGLMVGAAYIPVEVEGSFTTALAVYDRVEDIPQGMARYLRAMGFPMTEEQYGMPLQGMEALLDFAAGKGTVSAEDLYRLMQSAGDRADVGNLCNVGIGAMFSVLPQLKAEEPGPGPFSPQNAWQKVFNEPLPPGVTEENLSFAIGAEISKRTTATLGEEVAYAKGHSVFIAISFLGVPWQRAIEIAATPGQITRADLPTPVSAKLSEGPSWELERRTLAAVTNDTQRREGRSTLSIGGHDPIQLRQPVPSQQEIDEATAHMPQEEKDVYLERVTELIDYNRTQSGNAPGVYNFMADTILTQVTELVGNAEENRAQRIGVLEAMTQTTSNILRHLSPMARGSAPTAGLYEHSPYDTTVTRDGDLIRIHLETPPDSAMRAVLDYTVDKQGNIVMTDMVIGTNA